MSENIRTKNKEKGDLGENLVDIYLIKNGYEILYKNFKCNMGEIDRIFLDNNEIVFTEIKTRMNINYGYPAESVTIYKRKHILNTAKYFLYRMNMLGKSVRFDVIEVYLSREHKPIINHIKNVFW